METPSHKFKILFLCTWNAGRSIFAEYFIKDIGVGRFEAFSAGVTPKGQVSPITLKVLQDKFRIDACPNKPKRRVMRFRISRYSPIGHTKIPPNSRGHPSRWRRPIFESLHGFVIGCSYSITCRSISLIDFGLK